MWSFNPSNYRITIDESVVTIYANSSLRNVRNFGYIFTDGLLYFRANLSNGPHTLWVDNDEGAGFLGLDYVEVISVTGGIAVDRTPAASTTLSAGLPTVLTNSKHKVPIGAIVGLVVGVGVSFLLFLVAFILVRRRRRPESLDAQRNQIFPFDPANASSPPPQGQGRISEKGRMTTLSSVLPTATTSSSTLDLYPDGSALHLNEKRDDVARTKPPSTDETPDQTRVRELQDELARARARGVSSMAELQAMCRQLMQMVEQPRVANDDLQPPPEYDALSETRSAGVE